MAAGLAKRCESSQERCGNINLLVLSSIHFNSRLVIKGALELVAGALGSTFQKEEVGVRTYHLLHKSF